MYIQLAHLSGEFHIHSNDFLSLILILVCMAMMALALGRRRP